MFSSDSQSFVADGAKMKIIVITLMLTAMGGCASAQIDTPSGLRPGSWA